MTLKSRVESHPALSPILDNLRLALNFESAWDWRVCLGGFRVKKCLGSNWIWAMLAAVASMVAMNGCGRSGQDSQPETRRVEQREYREGS